MDHYDVLGVSNDADASVIKKAFRDLILKAHPDRPSGSAADFVKIREAHDVLSDADRRTRYDLSRRVGSKPLLNMFANMPREMGVLAVFTDILSDHIKQSIARKCPPAPPVVFTRRCKPPSRKPTTHSISLSLEECYVGKLCSFAISRKTACFSCEGKGAIKTMKNCIGCLGTGLRVTQRGIASTREHKCILCQGSKRRPSWSTTCVACGGLPAKRERVVIETKFAPGVASGSTNSIIGEGDSADGTTRGDVVVKVNQRKHRVFTRKGRDISCTMLVTLKQSLLGFSKEVKHLDGRKVQVSSREITKPGAVLVVENEGIPRGHGKLEIHIDVVFPESLCPRQKQAIHQLL